jgi:uncharacterized protein (DUF111 family)
VRWTEVERRESERSESTITVEGGAVRLKRREGGADIPALIQPEYDDLAALADRLGVSLAEARRRALDAAGPADGV